MCLKKIFHNFKFRPIFVWKAEFKCSDDILEILKSHPEIQRLPRSRLEPLLAGIVSLLATGVGFALTIHLGGVGALAGGEISVSAVLSLAGAASLTSGGSAGLMNAVRGGLTGRFSWSDWCEDVRLAAGTALIVFPLTLGAGHLAGQLAINHVGSLGDALLVRWGEEGSRQFVEKCIKVASSVVSSLGQAGGEAVKQAVKEGKVSAMSVIVSLVVGAFSGYNVGRAMTDEDHIRQMYRTFVDR